MKDLTSEEMDWAEEQVKHGQHTVAFYETMFPVLIARRNKYPIFP